MPQEITVIGNVVAEPEIKFTKSGLAVASFTVADTPRVKDTDGSFKDGDTIWWRVSIWRDPAENVAESLKKGDRVVVVGVPKQSNWEKDGIKFSRIELTASEVGVSLKWATARATKAPKGGGSSAPAGNSFASDSDEPPF